MKKLFALAAAVTLMMPIGIQASEEFYVGVQGGVNFLHCQFLQDRHIKFDAGYTVAGVLGYAWCYGLRFEGEVAYHNNDYRLYGRNSNAVRTTFHGNVDSWSFMANGYYDIPFYTCKPVLPYVGAGIGGDCVHQHIDIEGVRYKGNHSGFSWQVMTGVNCTYFEDVVLSVEYKFHVTPLRYGHHLQSHSLLFGIKKFFCF
jgi:opacity protein-like surface antigen